MILKGKDIVDAIKFIRPGSDFTMQEDDLQTLIWLDENTKKPTITEINKAKESLTSINQSKAQAKADLLARLGITEDEAKLLLS